MKIFYKILIGLFLIITNGYCQTIINGDFEINSLSTCLINSSNSVYNDSISNSWSFGNNSFSGIDIQKNICGYANSPNNLWFAGLAKNIVPPNGYWGNDELSLEIDVNLIAGNIYEISYYDYSPIYSTNNLIPLEIGLSLDSISFGDSIYSSVPSTNTWTLKTFLFTAPNSGKYLTVRNENTGTFSGWNFVDNFHFNMFTGISTIENIYNFALFPNPAKSIITISSTIIGSVKINYEIVDVLGKVVMQNENTGSDKFSININDLNSGIYFLRLQVNNSLVVKKFVKE